MPRFHFDVSDGGRLLKDDEGVEFADIATMQAQAIRAAGEIISEQTSFPLKPWLMFIRDERLRIITTLTLTASAN